MGVGVGDGEGLGDGLGLGVGAGGKGPGPGGGSGDRAWPDTEPDPEAKPGRDVVTVTVADCPGAKPDTVTAPESSIEALPADDETVHVYAESWFETETENPEVPRETTPNTGTYPEARGVTGAEVLETTPRPAALLARIVNV